MNLFALYGTFALGQTGEVLSSKKIELFRAEELTQAQLVRLLNSYSNYAYNAVLQASSNIYTLAHEIGHLLTDELTEDPMYRQVGWMTIDGHWNHTEKDFNLMRSAPLYPDEYRASKRLRKLQIEVIQSHSHAKNPTP